MAVIRSAIEGTAAGSVCSSVTDKRQRSAVPHTSLADPVTVTPCRIIPNVSRHSAFIPGGSRHSASMHPRWILSLRVHP